MIFSFRADVAQLAEQLICNQQVIGSSPIIGSLDLQLSWLEQPAHNRSVPGSSPRRSTSVLNIIGDIWPSGSVGQSAALSRRRSRVRVPSGSLQVYLVNYIIWGLSSAGRASALQAEGHRFEPYRPHLLIYFYMSVIAGVAELADAQDLKSCGTNLPYRFDSGRRHTQKPLIFKGFFVA